MESRISRKAEPSAWLASLRMGGFPSPSRIRLMPSPLPFDAAALACSMFANGFEAAKAFAEHQPDLIFLDVQMPKLTGFDVLELIGTDVSVIFTTAYDQYAMRAFEVHAVDYLLKPIGRERFEAALERVKSRLGAKMTTPHELAATARPPQQFLERLVVKDGTKVTLIPVSKLDYAEAQDDYVALAT